MPTDLTQVPDHPAKILLEEGQVRGALVLRTYEETRAVTFAALDNDALANVRESYERVAGLDYGSQRSDALEGLGSAVRDLLGLAD